MNFVDPIQLEVFKQRVAQVLHPIVPATNGTNIPKDFLFTAKKTKSSYDLPSYYFIYFLFVDLMSYENPGKFDKVAWSIPIDYNGQAFLIEYRKFGVGIFANGNREKEASEIKEKVKSAVKMAAPFFEYHSAEAAKQSNLSVLNESRDLFDRYVYFLKQYKSAVSAATKNGHTVQKKSDEKLTTYFFPVLSYLKKAKWLALAVIDGFFSWTEHIFILIAILNGKLATGEDVSHMAGQEWAAKFENAIPNMSKDLNIYMMN